MVDADEKFRFRYIKIGTVFLFFIKTTEIGVVPGTLSLSENRHSFDWRSRDRNRVISKMMDYLDKFLDLRSASVLFVLS